MQNLLYLEILESVSEAGFSLDELVYKTKELFEQEGMSGMVSLVLTLMDEKLCLDLCRGGVKSEGSWRAPGCCDSPRYEPQDRRARRFRTSVGEVRIQWRRLRCRNCGRSLIPLKEFLGIGSYQSKSNELERMVVEVVSDQSYRRSSKHLGLIGEIPVPKSTLHRWVADSDCDELIWSKRTKFLLADGTGYKRRPVPEQGLDNRGELRVVLGINRQGDLIPLGAFCGINWDEIGRRLACLRTDRKKKLGLLISDGESGLAEGLAILAREHQRCHWHLVRDLGYTLHQDQAPKEEREQESKHLAGILGIELPPGSVEMVQEQDRKAIAEQIQNAEQQLEALSQNFFQKGYLRAANYLNSAKKHLFNYLRFWLKYGILPPRTASRIERMMREIGRRLKRIAFGWSEAGAAKMARIIIKRITSTKQWEAYWKKKMRIEGRVVLVYRGVHVK